MKRYCFIGLLVVSVWALADDYVDDVYYSEITALRERLGSRDIMPSYDKSKMEEFTFVVDSVAQTVPTDSIKNTQP